MKIPGLRAGEYQGLPALLIDTPTSRAAVSLFGGHVLSFASKEFGEVLWMSPTTKPPPAPIRGGIPLCWPYFAKQGQPESAQQHGIARTVQWKLTLAQLQANGDIEIAMTPADAQFHALSLILTMRIGASFSQALTTVNLTDAPFTMSQALHTYFRVGDVRQVSVEGLEGKSYLDKFADFAQFTQAGDFKFDTRSDRIYQNVSGAYALNDPLLKRKITLTSEGSATLVVWNAGAESIKTFTDIPHDAWPGYLCLEVANASDDTITLMPGELKVISQMIGVQKLA